MRRRLPAVIALLALASATTPSAAPAKRTPRPAPSPLQEATFKGFTPSQESWIKSHTRRAPPQARRLLEHVAPLLTMRPGRPDELAGGDFTLTEVSEVGEVAFTVALSEHTLRRDAFGRHMVMHELGHAVDNGLIEPPLREDIEARFAASAAFLPCFQPPAGASIRCVPAAELFADQFAFFANGDRDARSQYLLPPFVSDAAFEALLRRAGPTQATVIAPARTRARAPRHTRAAPSARLVP